MHASVESQPWIENTGFDGQLVESKNGKSGDTEDQLYFFLLIHM